MSTNENGSCDADICVCKIGRLPSFTIQGIGGDIEFNQCPRCFVDSVVFPFPNPSHHHKRYTSGMLYKEGSYRDQFNLYCQVMELFDILDSREEKRRMKIRYQQSKKAKK